MVRQLIRITARRDGFRRAGVAHPAKPVDHPIDRFTDTQLAALKADPMLDVRIVDDPAAKAAADKAAADKAAAEKVAAEKAAAEKAAADKAAAAGKAKPKKGGEAA